MRTRPLQSGRLWCGGRRYGALTLPAKSQRVPPVSAKAVHAGAACLYEQMRRKPKKRQRAVAMPEVEMPTRRGWTFCR